MEPTGNDIKELKKINFKEFKLINDISKSKIVMGDARHSFSNILYTNCNSIAVHALAFKIYNSDGEIEISAIEESIIMQAANGHCTPAFIDSILLQLNKK